ncbi:MAG: tRNA lysidine(34) synthetase TilS [Dehalococcoidia bacterium]
MDRKATATARVAKVIAGVLARHRAGLGEGPLLLAVSGGADSIAMLLTTASLPRTQRPDLIAAYFAHGLRPDADPPEAALVRGAAERLGVAVRTGGAPVAPAEAAARDARYRFLAEQAQASGATAILTAHTQDDQAETLLLRLARGSGTRGAGGIREISTRSIGGADITLLRPLLTVTRRETEAVCREADITPAQDATNRSLIYARNRIRHAVLPELAQINPYVRATLARYAATAQEDDALLETLASEAVADTETWNNDGVRWPRAALAGLPSPLLSRVLQAAWRRLAGPGAALSAARLQAAQHLLLSAKGGETALGNGMRFLVEQESCALGPATTSPGLVEQPLETPGAVVSGPWRIEAEVRRPGTSVGNGQWTAMVDADLVGTPLLVRPRRPGDRFQPLGMDEQVRLQDVLVNARVPRSQRANWPLVVTPRGIVWVPGVRIAEWAKVTEPTKRVLVLSAEREAEAT